MKRLLALAWMACELPAQAPAFRTDVLPILEQNCFSCHRGEHTDSSGRLRKPKGGLRLDGKAWIEKGGKGGVVLAPGRAEQSALYTRTVLPADHDDRMPATGDPLSKEQAEVLRRWVDSGASFGDWVGEPLPATAPATSPATPSRTAGGAGKDAKEAPAGTRSLDLARVSQGLSPLPAAAIAKAAGQGGRVTPLWFGSALLRAEFPGQEDAVHDADVAALLPLAEHLAECVLARTKITDAACSHLARMPRLVRLDLRDTAITDGGVGKLAGLRELTVLNLFATRVTDASIDVLAGLPKLRELRLWQTHVTEAGVARLRQARPTLDVSLAPELPAAAPAGEAQRGRRRGR